MDDKSKNNKITFSAADMESDFSNESLRKSQIAPFSTPCCLHLHSRRKRLADADGISGKAAIDGLVHAGLLFDDSTAFVEKVSYSQEKIHADEMEETLIEVWV